MSFPDIAPFIFIITSEYMAKYSRAPKRKPLYQLPGENTFIDIQGSIPEAACENIGLWIFVSSGEASRDPLDLILYLLQNSQNLNKEQITHIIRGYITLDNIRDREPENSTEIWVDFGENIAAQLGIDDRTYYDRSIDDEGDKADNARKAIDFIAAVPKPYLNEFLLGLGLIGFKTQEEANNG